MIVFEFFQSVLWAGINILNGASVWLVFSFLLAGMLHEFLSPDKFQRMLGNRRISSIIKATVSGMFLPICSCGVIPLGLSMYYSGAYLGPTLAFMTATPVINPVALVLSFGLLGPEISIIYMLSGFIVPFVIGIVGNHFGGSELKAPGAEENIQARLLESENDTTWMEKMKSGFHWVLNDMGLVVSKYVIIGMLVAGFILTVFPSSFIQNYLGNPSMLSLGSIAVLAAIMYVCAVGHIPFIAALIASGAAPGVAITFLMAGAATNLPELISMYNIMGKRTVIIYSSVVITSSFFIGYIANRILLPGFIPVLSFDKVNYSIQTANKILFTAPEPIKYLCSLIIFGLFLRAIMPKVKSMLVKESH
ncbi:efflux transporter SaoE [Clostridiaceae bacterium 35-E11]